MSIGRNEPCPCGSGEKYKRCCLAKGDPRQASRTRAVTLATVVVVALAVVLGVAVSQAAGLTAAFVGFIAIGIWLWLFSPPPNSGGGTDPSAINYGR